jgi:4-amino-4-deoxy-L-arabinose transferase-like glycosyltransferase
MNVGLIRVVGMGLLLVVAAWVRWQYVVTISPYIDEFTTMWAAKQILAGGVPIMPSGVLYTRGLLDTYVTALFMGIGGDSFVVGRLPSLLFGLATIPLVWWIGKKGWGEPVGWLAAIGLLLLPEAIVWSGRARFYAPLQTFALLTVWTGYLSVKEQRATWRSQLTFALMFTLALFMQEETLLLYPAAVLAVVMWRGRKVLQEPPVLVAHLLCLGMMGLRYLIEIYGQPGYFETIQAERPYVGLFGDVLGTWQVYAPLFLDVERLIFTVGTIVAVVTSPPQPPSPLWRGGSESPQISTQTGEAKLLKSPLPLSVTERGRGLGDGMRFPTLYFALSLFSVLAIILLFVGDTWRDSRYLYFVQPLWLLLGAAGVWEIVRRIRRPAIESVVYAGVALLVVALLWTPAQSTLQQQQEGYDLALAYLATQRQAEDVVLTPQPPACALMLDAPCDYYTLQRGYEEYVIGRDGVLIDRWTGIPLLNSTAQFQEVIRAAPRTWLVIDGLRLATRYDTDFLATLIEQFEVVHDERGVAVLRADGWQEPPPVVAEGTFAEPLVFDGLRLERWHRSAAIAGEPLHITMVWHGEGNIDAQYQTFVHLIDATGNRVTQADGAPAKGMVPTVLFDAKPLPDIKTLDLPADLTAGWYRLDIGVYDADTLTPVGNPFPLEWIQLGDTPPPVVSRSDQWSNGLQLVGHDALPTEITPNQDYTIALTWTTLQPIPNDLTVFVHLLAADGTLLAQADRAPLGGFYPTTAWDVGETITDTYTFTTPADLPPPPYTLQVGWYSPVDFRRVPLADGGDALTVTTIEP